MSVSQQNFRTLMLWQLPLFNVQGTLCMSNESAKSLYGRHWTSVFSGRPGDNIAHSGMVSNTCAIEEAFPPLPRINCLFWLISTGDATISIARLHLNSKDRITAFHRGVFPVNRSLPPWITFLIIALLWKTSRRRPPMKCKPFSPLQYRLKSRPVSAIAALVSGLFSN